MGHRGEYLHPRKKKTLQIRAFISFFFFFFFTSESWLYSTPLVLPCYFQVYEKNNHSLNNLLPLCRLCGRQFRSCSLKQKHIIQLNRRLVPNCFTDFEISGLWFGFANSKCALWNILLYCRYFIVFAPWIWSFKLHITSLRCKTWQIKHKEFPWYLAHLSLKKKLRTLRYCQWYDRFTYLDRQDRDLTDMGWFFFQKVLQIHLETFKLCLISWNMARVQSLWWSLCFLAPPLSPQLAQKYWLNLHYRLRKTAASHSGWWQ